MRFRTPGGCSRCSKRHQSDGESLRAAVWPPVSLSARQLHHPIAPLVCCCGDCAEPHSKSRSASYLHHVGWRSEIDGPKQFCEATHFKSWRLTMKRFLTTLALVLVLAPAAMAQSYSTYDPAHANTADPGSAPLMVDRAPSQLHPRQRRARQHCRPGFGPADGRSCAARIHPRQRRARRHRGSGVRARVPQQPLRPANTRCPPTTSEGLAAASPHFLFYFQFLFARTLPLPVQQSRQIRRLLSRSISSWVLEISSWPRLGVCRGDG